MKKRYIADCLKEYAESDAVRLHMPGHKGEGPGRALWGYRCDITELSFSDNLANPSGIIARAQDDIARLTKARHSFILTGGSTLGVLAMVHAVRDRGNKMLISRSSHKSVYNALKLCGIEPVILNERFSDGLPDAAFINEEELKRADNGVIGALITSPDYFGRAHDLAKYEKWLHGNGKLLLVDGAHGAHFARFNNELYAGHFADAWVDGAHKSLRTLTQGAVLNVNNEPLIDKIKDALDIFSTSSPSYPIMASVEDGIKGLFEISSKALREFEANKKIVTDALESEGFKLLDGDDPFKIGVCLFGRGLKLNASLEGAGVFAELASPHHMLFMLSVDLTREQAERVASAVRGASTRKKNVDGELCAYRAPERKMQYLTATEKCSRQIELSRAEGEICARNAGVFPPCYPLITAGEVFDSSVIEALSAKNTFGVKDGTVKVVIKGEGDDD